MYQQDTRSSIQRLFEETAHTHSATITAGNLSLGLKYHLNVQTFEVYKPNIGSYFMTYVPEFLGSGGEHTMALLITSRKPELKVGAPYEFGCEGIEYLDGFSVHIDQASKVELITLYSRVCDYPQVYNLKTFDLQKQILISLPCALVLSALIEKIRWKPY